MRSFLAYTVLLLVIASKGANASAATQCSGLLQLKIDNTTLSEAVDVPAGQPVPVAAYGQPVQVTSLPAHCLVRGEVNHHRGADGKDYGDKFELRMPVEWKRRLLFTGGGGLDGLLRPALGLQGPAPKPDSKSALGMGYAVVSTDGGHQDAGPNAADGSFGSDPGARMDYNYRSTRLVTDVARKVIAQFYGHAIKYSYFQGCSNGGREGLGTAQRYPEEFDGVIAGAPAFNLTHAAIAEAWNTMQLASIAPQMPGVPPDLAQSLTEADLRLLVHAVLEKCDALDGLKDGMIFNPQACHFDPAVLKCAGSQTAECLGAEKVGVIARIFAGPHDSQGHPIYSSWPYDAGDAAPGWRAWMTGLGNTPSVNVLIFPAFYNGLALQGRQPRIDIFQFNFDTDPARINQSAAEINANSTDWSAFQKRKGKLLLYTGMSDPVFSANDLMRYYQEIEQNNGGEQNAQSFARLFLVPGMTHCSGGPGLDDFDTLGTMQAWVEQDRAPDHIVASGVAFPGRTRPLCAYPLLATYDGKGDPENWASFECRTR